MNKSSSEYLREKTSVACVDQSGNFKLWYGEIKSLLRGTAKEQVEAVIVIDEHKKPATEHVVRVEDVCPFSMMPEGLKKVLQTAGLVGDGPHEPIGRAPAATPPPAAPGSTAPRAGVAALEELAEANAAAGGEPLFIETAIPAEAVAAGDVRKYVGTPFLDLERQKVGLISQILSGDRFRIMVEAQHAVRIRELIAGEKMPGFSVSDMGGK